MENKKVVPAILAALFILSAFEACQAPLTHTGTSTVAWPESSALTSSAPAETATRNKVDKWLRQLPAADQSEAGSIFSEMLEAGSPVFQELGRRLVSPGEADDSLVRLAIDGLVTRAGLPGYERQKESLAADLLLLAATNRPDEVKKFLLEEAQYLISQKHLKLLAAHLLNPALAEYAVKAMLRAPGPELEKILLDNLDRIPNKAKIPVLEALGRLHSRSAVPRLKLLAVSADPEIKNTALTALAEIADPSAEPLLASIPTLSSSWERRQALALYLRFARRLAQNGYREKAREIAEKSAEILTDRDEVALRGESLSLLVELQGEKAIPAIIKGVWSEQPAYRQQALNLARKYGWPSLNRVLMESLASLPPENKAAVIEFLGQTARPGQLPAEVIEPLLEAQEEAVRLAAIRSFFNLKKEEAVPSLLSVLNRSEGQARLILALLKTLKPETYKSKLIEIFPQLPETSQMAVLGELEDFLGPEWKGVVLPVIDSENPELKKTAVERLALVVGGEDLDWVVDRLATSEDPALLAGWQKAVVAAAVQIPDQTQRQKKVLSLLAKKTGKEKANLLKMLYQVGGPECLKAVVKSLNDKSTEISGAALASLTNWPELEAVPHLVNLIKNNPDRKIRYLAFQGLARLMKTPTATNEEKLMALQEVKLLATYPDEKNFMLSAWASIKDIKALKEISEFFSDENLRDRAVSLACRLARPVAGEEGLKGFETIMILKKALPFLKEDLEIQETEDYLDKLLKQEGFGPLFNRKDLLGWKGLVGDPVQRARMKPEELAAQQKKADEDMRQHWKVIDGVVVFDGKGHSLCTAKDYCDFEMFVDWKIEPGGDSGIYLRGSPQVQIWDPAQWPEGSGGLYNNQRNPNKPLKCADNPVGTWNTFYIKMVDERVTVYFNGQLVVDNVVMENYWERDKPIYRCGQIELQAHNTPLYFKNIYIREIK
ncbi:MAG: family 16 glycoside hydrolase [Candidatus Saccharicenans sp.]